eukprot:TRINITY_DN67773_c0_g1_i1.p1 TRINITY_DN67773_c0_g1~~TRINITY_DN67773_c0_g1_i1.p1  ORF type:complete len:842 (+),score=128.84 TRINITY_DN67773_c0_g1_i1:210-2735(+)
MSENGTRQLMAGTYIAEQRETQNGSFYVIHAAALKQSPRVEPAKTSPRKRGTHRHDANTSLELPALRTIDPLLAAAAAISAKHADGEDSVRLPSLREDPVDVSPVASPSFPAPRQVFGRCCGVGSGGGRFRDATADQRSGDEWSPAGGVPSDEEFREWIRLPRKPVIPGRSVSPAVGSNFHIVLLRKSFEDPTNTPKRVAPILVEVFGFHPQAAEKKAVEAQAGGLCAVLCSVRSQSDAFEKAQQLRVSGLLVQVVSDAGLPDGCARGTNRKKPIHCTHTELIQRGLRGTEFSNSGKTARPVLLPLTARQPTSPKRVGLDSDEEGDRGGVSVGGANSQDCGSSNSSPTGPSGWRLGVASWQRREAPVTVVPEDPVAALFDAEDAAARTQDSPKKLPGLMNFVRKHKDDILQSRPVQEEAGPAEESKDVSTPEKSKAVVLMQRVSSVWIRATQGDQDMENSPSSPRRGLPRSRKDLCLMCRYLVFGNIAASTKSNAGVSLVTAAVMVSSFTTSHSGAADGSRRGTNKSAASSGAVGSSPASNKTWREEREQIFQETIGTKASVCELFRFWKKADSDGSGRVDIPELRNLVTAGLAERFKAVPGDEAKQDLVMPPSTVVATATGYVPIPDVFSCVGVDPAKDMQKFIGKACDKLQHMLLGKKSSFAFDEFMKVIWPMAGNAECRIMNRWCKEYDRQASIGRMKTPPLLDLGELEGLCSVFHHFDDDGSGSVSFDEMLAKGLIYTDQVEEYRREWDTNGDGSLDMREFCDMMCPLGFRASNESLIASTKDGVRLIYDPVLMGWRANCDGDHPPPLSIPGATSPESSALRPTTALVESLTVPECP